MSLPGRPKGEYRSAQHEGSSVSLPGRPKGEYRSAQHEGSPVSLPLSLDLAGLVPRANGLVALLGRVLAREPLSPGTLALELPEGLLADDRHGLRRTVEQLGQLGLPVWLDDFGAGGAALAGLRALPLAGLLLTPALVAGLPGDRDALAVLRGILTLADGLGLPTCAPRRGRRRSGGCPAQRGLRDAARPVVPATDGRARGRRMAGHAGGQAAAVGLTGSTGSTGSTG